MSDPAGTQTLAAESAPERINIQKYRLLADNGREKVFDRRLIYVGSAPDNHFVLDGDPTISRVHCKIEVDRTGHRLRDLDSKNGTFVNGVRVTEAWLPPECKLRIGETEVSFDVSDESVEVHLATRDRFGRMIGNSAEMREIFALLARVAPTRATLLVEGESGTGKELVAQAMHDESPRKDGPFVVFDCSAIAANLVESELFGHVRGAFTGAIGDRKGAFEQANGGTLFLDEIGELPPDLQPKLLRVLESKTVRPVGGNTTLKVDCRIVAATNRNLEQECQAGNFRQDLYYRLAVIKVRLPPLRNRREDIPLLVSNFVKAAAAELPADAPRLQISFETMAKLQRHHWSGNVRELRNFVERAVLLTDGGHIDTRFIEPPVIGPGRHAGAEPNDGEGVLVADYRLPFKDAKNRLTEDFERNYWSRLLGATNGNVSEAARQGGIHRKSLEYLLRKLDL